MDLDCCTSPFSDVKLGLAHWEEGIPGSGCKRSLGKAEVVSSILSSTFAKRTETNRLKHLVDYCGQDKPSSADLSIAQPDNKRTANTASFSFTLHALRGYGADMKLPWQRARNTPLEHLIGPTAMNPNSLRELNPHDLYRYVGGWKEGSAQHLAGMAEIRRRESKASLWAIWISLGSLAVAIFALLKGN